MMKVVANIRKKTSRLRNHVLHGHANEFTSFLPFLNLWKTSHLDDTSETITDHGIIKHIKADEVSVGGRLSDYLLTCNTYGENHPK